MRKLKAGDIVWIDHDAQRLVRNEEIAMKGIVMSLIPGDWYRVYMSWKEKTKVVDFPNHMLKRVDVDHVEKG